MRDKFKNIIYGEIDLDFDQESFAEEFDEHILPFTLPFTSVSSIWGYMRGLNKHWKMISDEKLEKYDNIIQSGGESLDGMTHYWRALNFLECSTPISGKGWRALTLNEDKTLKDQFKDLKITKWIYDNIPAEKMAGISCVTIDPGNFAAIHRDIGWDNSSGRPNPVTDNGLFRQGFLVVCLNITNGGEPLLWAYDHDKKNPIEMDAKCYISNDYFLHGVRPVATRRRQIRVTFKPKKEFFNLIKPETAVMLPDDYRYQESGI